MAEITVTEADLDSLVSKLASLDLSEREEAILSALLYRLTEDAEVEGFKMTDRSSPPLHARDLIGQGLGWETGRTASTPRPAEHSFVYGKVTWT